MEILQPLWRGRSISLRKDSAGKKHTAMTGNKALLYIPVKVLEDSVYRITIELYRESGNGIIYCNLYGNKNFDFPTSKIECDRDGWCTFDVDVIAKSFPKTVPLMFRIWRGSNGTGTILVSKIIVELIKGKVKPQKEGVIVSVAKAAAPSKKKPPGRKKKLSTRVPTSRNLAKRNLAKRKMSVNRSAARQQRNSRGDIVPRLPIGKFLPKVDPLMPGTDGIKVSVIISMKNRADFLNRTLFTYAKQTMSKKEFEIIIVDDGSTDDILGLCKKHAKISGLQFQHIRVDSSKGAIKQKGWTPALTNNIGFKKARGSVLVITGPETLQKETNMEQTWKACHGPTCVYGVVYKSNERFVDAIKKNLKWIEYEYFKTLMNDHKADLERPSTGGFWWYYAATRKEYIMTARGVDERFMLGISGEDDDFAARMRFLGLRLMHDHDILGIHQNHSREDRVDATHKFRFNRSKWRNLRAYNLGLLMDCRKSGDPIVNKGINWGAEEAIVDMEVF